MSGEPPASKGELLPTGPREGGAAHLASIDAFVSYASSDSSIANSLVLALEKRGLRCWIAPRDVVPGTLYADGIARAIDGAKVLVLVLSERAVESRHVGKEIERASSRRRPIIALHTDSAPLTPAFEYFLSESQWIDTRPGGIEGAADKLVEAIQLHVNAAAANEPPLRSPRPVQSRQTAVPQPKWLIGGGIAAVLLALLGYFFVDHLRSSGHAQAAKRLDTANPAPPPASIAVLAFSDLSPDGSQGYFSDGIAEEILNVLAHVNGLKVASRTSSFQFRKSDLSAPAIAQKLGVRHILEGSVRKAGETVRVTAQLIDAKTDQHEWSESFDRPLSTANLFAIQDEIARSIVGHLAAAIGGGADISKPAARVADTANEDAYDLYLKGRSLFIARTRENLAEAARLLKVAVAKDERFARAWEMLGAVLVTEHYWELGRESDYQAGVDATDRALRLDPNLSLAYAVRGELQLDAIPSRGVAGWEDSSEDFSRAIAHDRTNATAHAWLGSNDAALGYFERAVQDYQRCLDIDPAYELCRRKIAALYLYMGRTDDALRLYQQGLENGYLANGVPFAPVLAARGERLSALGILAEVYAEYPQLIRPLYRALTDPTFSDHDRQDALAVVDKERRMQTFATSAVWMLRAYDRIGERTQYPEPPIWWAREDPAWLASESRKQAMRRWHLPEYWRKHGLPPQCKAVGTADFECR